MLAGWAGVFVEQKYRNSHSSIYCVRMVLLLRDKKEKGDRS